MDKILTDSEKVILLDAFERATLELDWAKFGRTKTAQKRFNAKREQLLRALLGRNPTVEEVRGYL